MNILISSVKLSVSLLVLIEIETDDHLVYCYCTFRTMAGQMAPAASNQIIVVLML